MSDTVFIRHARVRGFTTLSNASIRDPDISWKAKGLLLNLHSHADNFELSVKRLLGQTRDGRDSTYAGIKELQVAGYLEIVRERGDHGRYVRITWIVRDEASADHRGALESSSPEQSPLKAKRARRGPATVQVPPLPENPEMVAESDRFRKTRNPVVSVGIQEATVKAERTTTTAVVVVDESGVESLGLIYPRALTPDECALADAQLVLIESEGVRQKLLDELAGALAANRITSSWGAWFRSLCIRAVRGEFVPSQGLAVSKQRNTAAAEAAEADRKRAEVRDREARLAKDRIDPVRQMRIRTKINEAAQLLGGGRKHG